VTSPRTADEGFTEEEDEDAQTLRCPPCHRGFIKRNIVPINSVRTN